MIFFHLLLGYQLELAIACVDAWEFAPAQPRLKPEVNRAVRTRLRRMVTVSPVNL